MRSDGHEVATAALPFSAAAPPHYWSETCSGMRVGVRGSQEGNIVLSVRHEAEDWECSIQVLRCGAYHADRLAMCVAALRRAARQMGLALTTAPADLRISSVVFKSGLRSVPHLGVTRPAHTPRLCGTGLWASQWSTSATTAARAARPPATRAVTGWSSPASGKGREDLDLRWAVFVCTGLFRLNAARH